MCAEASRPGRANATATPGPKTTRLYPHCRHSAAFTLVEVAFSLVILASAVTFTILILGGALRDQQLNRYRILAAAKATTLLEQFSQPQEDFHANGPYLSYDASRGMENYFVPNSSWNNRYTTNYYSSYRGAVPAMVGQMGMRLIRDIPAMSVGGRYDLERIVGSNLGGCYPVPTPIARRLDSNQNEIQDLCDRGTKLFYFDPTERSGSNLAGAAVVGAGRNAATEDLQRLVFAIIGPPQQNFLPSHPWMAPPVKLYPFPPSHLETTANPGSLRIWNSGVGISLRMQGQTDAERIANGYGMWGSILARQSNTDNAGYVYGDHTDSSNWEWQAFTDVSKESVAVRDKILRGEEWDNPQARLLCLPDPNPDPNAPPPAWRSDPAVKWSPWVAGAPEFRRLLHWHWNRIRCQLDGVTYSYPPPPPAPPPPPGYIPPRSGHYVDRTETVFVDPWPTEDASWTDDNGIRHPYTRQIWPRPTQTRVIGQTWVWDGPPAEPTGGSHGPVVGFPTPTTGLGMAVGLRGTDILYEDHEPFPGNRLEQVRQGLPSLERRVMYRTAALALWAKTRVGKSILKAEARLLGSAADSGAVLEADPNVAGDVVLAKQMLPDAHNPLLGFVPPPDDPKDIHPAQVLALNYLAHAAMLVTGYRPPFIDNQNSMDAARQLNLHASVGDRTKNVRNRYYRKFGQETFYLANPMYCQPIPTIKRHYAANDTTQPWVEETMPPSKPPQWKNRTWYGIGDQVTNNGNKVYYCHVAGLSARIPDSGPAGTGDDIQDGDEPPYPGPTTDPLFPREQKVQWAYWYTWQYLEPEPFAKSFIWSLLTDNYNRLLDPVKEMTLPLVPGKPPVLIDSPNADRLCRVGKPPYDISSPLLPTDDFSGKPDRKKLIKVRRFYEGGAWYRDWRGLGSGRGRPNAIMVGSDLIWEMYSSNPDDRSGVAREAGAMNDPLLCFGTDLGGAWKPSRWGPEDFGQDKDSDGLNDDAVVNPFPPPFAQEGAFDCWGNRKFRWRVIAPVGRFNDQGNPPAAADFTHFRSFMLKGGLEDIAFNDNEHWLKDEKDLDSWPDDPGPVGWSPTDDPARDWSDANDVLCGPIEAQYMSALPKSGVLPPDCDDLLMAKNALRTCMAWVMKYTNRYPNDFVVPKPANGLTAWHRPLFFYDLFKTDGKARRPSDPVNFDEFHPIGWTGDTTFPAVFARLATMPTVDSLFNQYVAGNGTTFPASAVRKGDGTRSDPPFAKLTSGPTTEATWEENFKEYPYKDILRIGPPRVDGASNVSGRAIPNPGNRPMSGHVVPLQGALVLSYLHGCGGTDGGRNGVDDISLPTPQGSTKPGASTSNNLNSNWYAPELGKTDETAPKSDAIQAKIRTVANPSRLHYPLNSPANNDPILPKDSHAWQFQPFAVADRCRQLVFWVVDWKSYEDSETIPSDPVDLSQAPLAIVPSSYGSYVYPNNDNPLRGRFNPERMLCWLNQARDRTVALPRHDFRTNVITGQRFMYFDNRTELGLANMPVGSLNAGEMGVQDQVRYVGGISEADDSGDSKGLWYYANMGRFGADRDGNGVLTRNAVSASQRMRAREVGRFVYYDPVLPLSTRR